VLSAVIGREGKRWKIRIAVIASMTSCGVAGVSGRVGECTHSFEVGGGRGGRSEAMEGKAEHFRS